jgi:hypothetical protein
LDRRRNEAEKKKIKPVKVVEKKPMTKKETMMLEGESKEFFKVQG